MQDLGHPSIGQLNLKSDWIIELSRAKEERDCSKDGCGLRAALVIAPSCRLLLDGDD